MADQFAANGYYTLLPDLFDGDPVPMNMEMKVTLMEWLQNGTDGKHPHTTTVVDPIVEKAIKYLREEKGFKKIGAVGYCFVSFYTYTYVCKRLTMHRAESMLRASWPRVKGWTLDLPLTLRTCNYCTWTSIVC
jgi:dienelactone hydrolase